MSKCSTADRVEEKIDALVERWRIELQQEQPFEFVRQKMILNLENAHHHANTSNVDALYKLVERATGRTERRILRTLAQYVLGGHKHLVLISAGNSQMGLFVMRRMQALSFQLGFQPPVLRKLPQSKDTTLGLLAEDYIIHADHTW